MKRRRLNRAAAAVALLLGLAGVAPRDARATGAANDHTVLILDSTVSGGINSVEAVKAMGLGMDVEVVDNAGWGAKSFADFRSYRALVLGDPDCSGVGSVSAAEANATVWGPAINGNLIIIGTDEFFHDGRGGNMLTEGAMSFAVNEVGKTGGLISLSCYYSGDPPHTPVPVLDGINPGGFVADGTAGDLCYNNAHIVASHPALALVTDTALSNWSCSVHEGFEKWPADFLVLAIAKDLGSAFTAADGTVGTPYILARGKDLRARGLSLSPVSATNATGAMHTVTATLTDAEDNPVAGTLVAVQVTAGPNTGAIGTCVPADCKTDAAGHMAFTYTGAGGVGTDSIIAFLDANGNGALDAGEAQTTASKTWIIFDPFGGIVRTGSRSLKLKLHKPSPDTTGVRCVQTDTPGAPDFDSIPFTPFPDGSDDVELDISLTGDDGSKSVCCEFQGGTPLAPVCSAIDLQTKGGPGGGAEICDNCIDDDGNGATDFEDAACCANPESMQVTTGKVLGGKGGLSHGKLRLKTILAQLGFADVNPMMQDTTIQLRNANGELFCATVAHQHWMKRHRKFQFWDHSGTVASGLTDGTIVTGRSGRTRFRTHGKLDLTKYDQPELTVTVRVGDRCSTGTVTLRKKGTKGLVFP